MFRGCRANDPRLATHGAAPPLFRVYGPAPDPIPDEGTELPCLVSFGVSMDGGGAVATAPRVKRGHADGYTGPDGPGTAAGSALSAAWRCTKLYAGSAIAPWLGGVDVDKKRA